MKWVSRSEPGFSRLFPLFQGRTPMRKLLFLIPILLVLFAPSLQAEASTGTIYYDVDVCCSHWTTLTTMAGVGGGTNCCVTPSNTIALLQVYPDYRACHYRVYYRIPGSGNDYHSATTTIYPGSGYVTISPPPQDVGASRFDIQGNCDSYQGAMAGQTYAN